MGHAHPFSPTPCDLQAVVVPYREEDNDRGGREGESKPDIGNVCQDIWYVYMRVSRINVTIKNIPEHYLSRRSQTLH